MAGRVSGCLELACMQCCRTVAGLLTPAALLRSALWPVPGYYWCSCSPRAVCMLGVAGVGCTMQPAAWRMGCMLQVANTAVGARAGGLLQQSDPRDAESPAPGSVLYSRGCVQLHTHEHVQSLRSGC